VSERYISKRDDCLLRIAFERGFDWQTLWDHPENADLRQHRQNPNLLKSGDLVFIPDREPKELARATDSLYRFVRRGVPAMLRLRIVEEPDESTEATGNRNGAGEQGDRPRVHVPYVLEIEGELHTGETGPDGILECPIRPNATRGRLHLEPGTPRETVYAIRIGCLDPESELSGCKHRLANLGFSCGDFSDEDTEALHFAVEAFQRKFGLAATGDLDQPTRNKLRDLHGA
jgi:hypothetical protein